MWNSAPIVSRVIASAAGTPPSRNARRIAFVAACAFVGPAASLRANSSPSACSVGVRHDAVHDAPVEQLGRLVETRGEDELRRP